MKIEVDLSDILRDPETGEAGESFQESIRRQIVAVITAETQRDVKLQIKQRVSEVLDEELVNAVREQMPALVAQIMDYPYQPVSRYGQRSDETTFRAELAKALTEQMTYKKESFPSNSNAFTKAVDDTVRTKLSEFQAAWSKQVDGEFMKQAMAHATDSLRKRLGIAA